MAPDKLRVGVIGVGFYALRTHVPALQESDRAEIVAISRRHAEHLETIREGLVTPRGYTDWRQMLECEPLDAVVIATSHAVHAEQTIAALKKGLHVLVEKPMASTSSDAWAMVDAAKRSGKILMVSYQSRYRGLYQTVKKALECGAIGTVRQIHCIVSHNMESRERLNPAGLQDFLRKTGMPLWFVTSGIRPGAWRRDAEEAGGGLLADTGSHYIDLALWFAGSPSRRVAALKEPAHGSQETSMNVQVHMENGCLVSISVNATSPNQVLWRILGDTGTLSCDGDLIWVDGQSGRTELSVECTTVRPVDAFLSMILDGAANLSPPNQAAHVVEVTQAAYTSALHGEFISLSGRGPA